MATFNPQTFLSQVGNGKTTLKFPKKQILFSQGDTTDAVFYVQAGKVKLTVVSPQGKEAVIAILEPGSFFGEGCLAGQLVHLATATAVEDARIVRIDKPSMLRLLQDDRTFSALFLALYAGSERSHPRGLGGSTLQLQREAAGADSAVNGPFRKRR